MAGTDTPSDAGAAARALGVYDKPMVDDTVRLMRQSQAEKEAKTAPIYERMERDYARDREAVDAARDRYKPVEEIKPPTPPVNDPLQAFGSAASMFAMLASAFTHTPAINAMNGMAAAINGKRKGDLEAYELGYKQWKDNTELAIQNHKLQAEDLRLAMEAMRNNIALGRAMANAVAAKTDDRVAMRLLEQGQYEKLDELTRARETHAEAMKERKAKIEAHELLGRKESYGPDGKLTEEAHRKLMAGDPELAIRMQVAEQGKPGQPFNVKLPDGKTGLAVSVGGQIVDASTRMPLPAGTVRAGVGGAASTLTGWARNRLEKTEADRAAKGLPPLSDEEAGRLVRTLSGRGMLNEKDLDTLETRATHTEAALDAIDKINEIVARTPAVAGIFNRPLQNIETIANLTGFSNDTDRHDFQSAVNFLKLNAPALLKGANPTSRAIAGDTALVDSIIRGGNWGDTKQNVTASMQSLERLLRKDLELVRAQSARGGRTQDAAPTAGGSAQPPARPASLVGKPGLEWNAGLRKWRDSTGQIYREDGSAE